MDPSTKSIVEEVKAMRESMDAFCSSLLKRIDGVEKTLGDRFQAIETAAVTIDSWKAQINASVDDLRLDLGALRKTVNRVVLEAPHASSAGMLPKPAPMAASTSDAKPDARLDGRRDGVFRQEFEMGRDFTHAHFPHKGMTDPPHPNLPRSNSLPHFGLHDGSDSFSHTVRTNSPEHQSGRLPKLNFPCFDGENPRLWLRHSKDYFELYNVSDSMWIRVATMHFSGAAARWLHSIDSKLPLLSWPQFCKLLLDRFGRDQHELLVRQMLNIEQSDRSVSEYVEQFAELVDQLAAYESTTDSLHYTMRFIQGLHPNLRASVLMQRPSTLDAAYVLAQLQEEVSVSVPKQEVRSPVSVQPRPNFKGACPLPLPPKLDKSQPIRAVSESPHTNSTDAKWSALRAYRRARGLCDRCADKWSRDHKCGDTVQLNVLQEVLELFQLDNGDVSLDSSTSSETDQLFLTLSVAAVSGSAAPHTLCLQGQIQGHSLSILVDSGSSHTFINEQLAGQLSRVLQLSVPLAVRVANGTVIQCASYIPRAEWSVQQCTFLSELRVLPLSAYDMILGLDWLGQHSPMKVHWAQQWLSIPYDESMVILYGTRAQLPAGTLLQLCAVTDTASIEPSTPSIAVLPAVQRLIDEFAELFTIPTALPPERAFDHSIPLIQGASPVNIRPYRYAPALKDEIERQVAEMLAAGTIQKSSSPFSSPVLLVKKKDNSLHFCVDYRHLNAITVKAKYHVPIIDELLDELAGASWFTGLDLAAGFHQIRVRPGEEHKTAFQTHHGHFEFRVMAFGLTGAPGTFQAAMNTTLAPYLRKFVFVFFDDILIYSRTEQDHMRHLRLVFELLAGDQWKLKLSKCSFAQRQISYLGHVISGNGVATDPQKIAAIASWSSPTNAKELRSFLGKFVRHFGVISKPLFDLLKKNTIFVWTHIHEQAFATLKHALCTAPVLALPDFSKVFHVETDACGTGVGAVLLQDGHPIAYLSKALGPRSQGLSAYEKEYLAILLAVQQWRPYLLHKEFVINTDQRSLTQLIEQRFHTTWQQKVYSKLIGLQHRIQYKPGADNRVADALSRKSSHESQCVAISTATLAWILKVQDSYQKDTIAHSLLTKLSLAGDSVPFFSLDSGSYLVLQAFHASAVGGHSGIPATYHRIKGLFYWKGLKHDVHRFVRDCQVCQQAKPDRSRLPGLLQPLPVPEAAWQIVSLDFVEGLPVSGHVNCILVVVDLFTKYSHFIALRHPFTTAVVARLFLNNVYRLHGLPQSLVSDRDRVFTSQFWRELFALAGVQLCMSSSYHPQSDGQTERVNQCMETYLRCYVHACPTKWSDWLPLAEYWYNTSYHSAINCSPFEALYGHSPRHYGISSAHIPVPELSSWMQERELMNRVLQQQLLRAKERMKRQADKGHSERAFQVGDMVFLKLQPYVQTSLASRANQKLSYKFFGPFRILARIGTVAYKLDLPATSSVHPVVHISQLKLAVGAGHQVTPTMPLALDTPRVPVQVLGSKLVSRGSRTVKQVLVQWSGLPSTLATWEDAVALQQRFPHAAVWGQAAVQGRGMLAPLLPVLMDCQRGRAGPTAESSGRTRFLRLHACRGLTHVIELYICSGENERRIIDQLV
ncbi:hypothetical protein U9M48_035065 [Paspalum notatum var. saurae]|uniref:Reverse transcriptase n=1 Tax=Paspalum notatum var. saurae TaxID=547442 RepID=A0AAQ3X9M0_PASNO